MKSSNDEFLVANREIALKRLAGNEVLLAKLAEFFLEDAPLVMKQLQDAYDCGDLTLVAHKAHGLKGLSATFEAISVCNLTREIELASRSDERSQLAQKIPLLWTELQRLILYLEQVVAQSASGGGFDRR